MRLTFWVVPISHVAGPHADILIKCCKVRIGVAAIAGVQLCSLVAIVEFSCLMDAVVICCLEVLVVGWRIVEAVVQVVEGTVADKFAVRNGSCF